MKLFQKEQVRGNGKIVVTDFRKLNPNDFKTLYSLTKEEIKKEVMLYSPDGRLFINNREDCSELLTEIFEYLMPYSQYDIEQFAKKQKQRFKEIKSLEDWGEYAKTETDNNKRIDALGMLLVPAEVKRRQLEKSYYKSK